MFSTSGIVIMDIICVLGLHTYSIEFLLNHTWSFQFKRVRWIRLPFEEHSVLRIGLRKVFIFNSEDHCQSGPGTSSITKLESQNNMWLNQCDSNKIHITFFLSALLFFLLCLICLSCFLAFPQINFYYSLSALTWLWWFILRKKTQKFQCSRNLCEVALLLGTHHIMSEKIA